MSADRPETTKGKPRGTRMWGLVGRGGRVVQVAKTKADVTVGFHYHIELGNLRPVRVVVAVEKEEPANAR
jgi:hypothetical protein